MEYEVTEQFQASNNNQETMEGEETELPGAVVKEFESSLRGELVRPGHDGYDQARAVWNGMVDNHPALIARCRGTADVVSAVKFARLRNLLLAVRGGGHNVAGNDVCDGGAVAILTGQLKGKIQQPDGNEFDMGFRLTSIRVKEGDEWKIVHWHESPMQSDG